MSDYRICALLLFMLSNPVMALGTDALFYNNSLWAIWQCAAGWGFTFLAMAVLNEGEKNE